MPTIKTLLLAGTALQILAGAAWAGEVEKYFPTAKWAKRAEAFSFGSYGGSNVKFELFTSRPSAFPGRIEQNWAAMTTDMVAPYLNLDGSVTTQTFKYARIKTSDAVNFVQKLSLVDWRYPSVYKTLGLCDAPSTKFTFFGKKQTVSDICGPSSDLPHVGAEMINAMIIYGQLQSIVDASKLSKPIGKLP